MSSVLGTYARKAISFTEGKGSYLFTESGDKYLDFVQGIATNVLGHCHKHLVKAIQNQSEKLWHVSNAFEIPEQERLAKRLTNNTFADFVCFQNSGTEATEASIKIARKYFHKIGKPEKNRIITFQGAFHGRTLAALFAANNPKHIEGFDPKVEGFDQVPFADQEKLKKTIMFITHDFDEALRLADRIAIMKDGIIEQLDTPAKIVLNPATEYVKKFTEEVPREKVLKIEAVMDPVDDVKDLSDLKVSKNEIIENVAEKILTQEKSVAVIDENNKIVGTVHPSKIIHTVFGGRKNKE